jgi:CDP-paratose 2-epimerase
VDDLVDAFQLGAEKIDSIAGEVFNIGGGPANTISVWSEFGSILAELKRERIPVRYGEWRRGDQRCYVSDIRKAKQMMGWEPQVDRQTGIRRLWDWVKTEGSLFRSPSAKVRHAAAAI